MQIIYKATNLVNGKVYIGKTSQPFRDRLNDHLLNARKGSKSYFHNAIRKYGKENFEWKIIQECITENHLNLAEQAYIELYKMQGFELYNMTYGGEGSCGLAPWNKGKSLTEETKQKIRESCLGRTISEEHKQKISEAQKNCSHAWKIGRTLPEETKQKISEAMKGKPNIYLKGKSLSEERKQKIKDGILMKKILKQQSNTQDERSTRTR